MKKRRKKKKKEPKCSENRFLETSRKAAKLQFAASSHWHFVDSKNSTSLQETEGHHKNWVSETDVG